MILSWKFVGVITAAALVTGLAGCNPSKNTAEGGKTAGTKGGSPAGASAGMVRVIGSDTLLQLAQAWAEAYQKVKPDTMVTVTGGGSAVGITKLINGQAEIADASRPMEPKETEQARARGINPVEHIVAQDALSIIVNAKNPLKELTMDQLAAVYLGDTTNWKDLGGPDQPILAAARDTSSGTYLFFKEHVLKKKEYGPKVLHLPSNTAIAQQVGQDAGAIGYVGMGYVTPGVKAIPVKKDASSPAVPPSVANVLNRTYSLSRPLYMYTNGQPSGVVKAFIDYVTGPDGQKIVAQKEFIPVKQ
jgi:phosphate transport system substrate-binding protein